MTRTNERQTEDKMLKEKKKKRREIMGDGRREKEKSLTQESLVRMQDVQGHKEDLISSTHPKENQLARRRAK